jgi:hypothetical protein
MSRTADNIAIAENLVLAAFVLAVVAVVATIAREILSSWHWPFFATVPSF